MSDGPRSRLRENATEIAAMVVTGLWLALLFLPGGGGFWLPVLLFGYLVVVPIVALLYGDESDRETWWDWWDDDSWDDWWGSSESDDANDESSTAGAESSNSVDALETLRERYAAGELTDDQFERKLERLLETETLEDVERDRRNANADRDRGRDRDRDVDSNLEYET
ncbi:SHOCT domain-containing protein [Natrarchaeobius oligotrophus]|uniref:SHOCT domain-containing protein n=1 Tax=Natrarchaeobius chitinivorans TaxID=1679083 RepID=A0A3N6MJB5_NATCH|nr:SHOCT domain-containing protein [Natrarchaeobius chitinivorans]RQH01375.1 SHOCT domain-containing protein [Natrarchaeobius chitinivorans]